MVRIDDIYMDSLLDSLSEELSRINNETGLYYTLPTYDEASRKKLVAVIRQWLSGDKKPDFIVAVADEGIQII